MYEYCSRNDIGVYYKVNDDKFMINGVIVEEGDYEGEVPNFISAVLCDGVGGQQEGYRAALMTLEKFKEITKENLSKEEIIDKVKETNDLVRKTQREENKENGLKTTLVGIYANEDIFIYYNLGDSRAYRYRNGYFQRLTKDDSKVQGMIDDGVITYEEAINHPEKNIDSPLVIFTCSSGFIVNDNSPISGSEIYSTLSLK